MVVPGLGGLNAHYDAWSILLEADEASVGWNWAGMFNYMKKVRGFLSITLTFTSG
jgi:hypothetical protein